MGTPRTIRLATPIPQPKPLLRTALSHSLFIPRRPTPGEHASRNQTRIQSEHMLRVPRFAERHERARLKPRLEIRRIQSVRMPDPRLFRTGELTHQGELRQRRNPVQHMAHLRDRDRLSQNHVLFQMEQVVRARVSGRGPSRVHRCCEPSTLRVEDGLVKRGTRTTRPRIVHEYRVVESRKVLFHRTQTLVDVKVLTVRDHRQRDLHTRSPTQIPPAPRTKSTMLIANTSPSRSYRACLRVSSK